MFCDPQISHNILIVIQMFWQDEEVEGYGKKSKRPKAVDSDDEEEEEGIFNILIIKLAYVFIYYKIFQICIGICFLCN